MGDMGYRLKGSGFERLGALWGDFGKLGFL